MNSVTLEWTNLTNEKGPEEKSDWWERECEALQKHDKEGIGDNDLHGVSVKKQKI